MLGLRLGMTKAEVRAKLGPPEAESYATRNYPEPPMWKYGDIELTFLTHKRRIIPDEGAKLLRINCNCLNPVYVVAKECPNDDS